MQVNELYRLWCEKAMEDPALTEELASVKGNEKEIEDRFYQALEFGTGGLRGIIGAGTNRMNIYTVRHASIGIAAYLKKETAAPSIVIAYDARINSEKFAKEAARTYAAHGVKTYLFPVLMPTPVLSFAVRTLGCDAGVVITASHNPAEYNGYKAYGSDGCQITNLAADTILAEIRRVEMFDDTEKTPFTELLAAKMIEYVDDSLLQDFLTEVQKQSVYPNMGGTSGLKFVYSPLNGTGNIPVRAILERNGYSPIIVPEQELPDGNFPTCRYPNPEEKDALTLALKLASEQNADLLIATDPDCDRLGAAVKKEDDTFQILSGNEVGFLLLNYLLEAKGQSLPKDGLSVKTVVTSDIVFAIAKKYGIGVIEVLTGFKYIGEVIGTLEKKGETHRYVFGFEESCGYLAGTHARDKDAVVASMLFIEMAAYYKSKGASVLDILEALYKEFGYYTTRLVSITLKGKEGAEKIAAIMQAFRANPPKEIGGAAITCMADYQGEVDLPKSVNKQNGITLPSSNVLVFETDELVKVIVRPSGTEPKIKIYYSATAPSAEAGNKKIDAAALEFEKHFK